MSISIRRDVFQAIADPTRRRIISLIAFQAMTLNAIADNFEMSRPAISQHIKILSECGMVSIEQKGRERYCVAKLDDLREVSSWIEQYRELWNKKFDALDEYLNKIQNTDKKEKK